MNEPKIHLRTSHSFISSNGKKPGKTVPESLKKESEKQVYINRLALTLQASEGLTTLFKSELKEKRTFEPIEIILRPNCTELIICTTCRTTCIRFVLAFAENPTLSSKEINLNSTAILTVDSISFFRKFQFLEPTFKFILYFDICREDLILAQQIFIFTKDLELQKIDSRENYICEKKTGGTGPNNYSSDIKEDKQTLIVPGFEDGDDESTRIIEELELNLKQVTKKNLNTEKAMQIFKDDLLKEFDRVHNSNGPCKRSPSICGHVESEFLAFFEQDDIMAEIFFMSKDSFLTFLALLLTNENAAVQVIIQNEFTFVFLDHNLQTGSQKMTISTAKSKDVLVKFRSATRMKSIYDRECWVSMKEFSGAVHQNEDKAFVLRFHKSGMMGFQVELPADLLTCNMYFLSKEFEFL